MRQFTLAEQREYCNRIIRRANVAAGYETKGTLKTWTYICDVGSGEVEAINRSEARRRIKEHLGFKKKHRLPKEIIIERVDNAGN